MVVEVSTLKLLLGTFSRNFLRKPETLLAETLWQRRFGSETERLGSENLQTVSL